jgi:hypothetical protein
MSDVSNRSNKCFVCFFFFSFLSEPYHLLLEKKIFFLYSGWGEFSIHVDFSINEEKKWRNLSYLSSVLYEIVMITTKKSILLLKKKIFRFRDFPSLFFVYCCLYSMWHVEHTKKKNSSHREKKDFDE